MLGYLNPSPLRKRGTNPLRQSQPLRKRGTSPLRQSQPAASRGTSPIPRLRWRATASLDAHGQPQIHFAGGQEGELNLLQTGLSQVLLGLLQRPHMAAAGAQFKPQGLNGFRQAGRG